MIKELKGNKTYIFPDFSWLCAPRAYVLIRTLRSWKTLTHRHTLEDSDCANSIQSVWCIFIAKTKTRTKLCKTALTTCRAWLFNIAKKFLLTNRQWQLVSRQLQFQVYKHLAERVAQSNDKSNGIGSFRLKVDSSNGSSPRLRRFAQCVFVVL